MAGLPSATSVTLILTSFIYNVGAQHGMLHVAASSIRKQAHTNLLYSKKRECN